MPRMTVAQAVVAWLANQYVERDGERRRFFEGVFGIFGHGNVAGLGEALEAAQDATQSLSINSWLNTSVMRLDSHR